MVRTLALATALAALSLAGCGDSDDGPDLTGVWTVTAHTANDTGCTPGAEVLDPPYIKFTRETIFGQSYYTFVGCQDVEGTTCEGSLFGGFYAEAIENGWRSAAYIAAGDDANCSLSAQISDAVVQADGALLIESRTSESVAGPVPAGTCTTDEAEARLKAGTLTCARFESMTAQRVAGPQ